MPSLEDNTCFFAFIYVSIIFRKKWKKLMKFLFYLPGMVSVGQFYYQRGMLYRLRSLGERHNMDITVGEKWF